MSTILNFIGQTPFLELKRLTLFSSGTKAFVKCEGGNPGGSIKDRAALYMIRAAEKSGVLTKGKTILEASSGNMGISLALIGAVLGYRVKVIMSAGASRERRDIIMAMGAELETTPVEQGTDGAIRRTMEIVKADPDQYFWPNQFANYANSLAHYETTGPEIYRQSGGQIDILVAGIGTGGTLMGTGRFLHERKHDVKIIGIEPPPGHHIQGLKNMTESAVPAIFDRRVLDDVVMINDEEAYDASRKLAVEEGILAGMSSGAAVAGAGKISCRFPGSFIVVILPDRGDRYLSTDLFRESRLNSD